MNNQPFQGEPRDLPIDSAGSRKFLSFLVDGETYAIAIDGIKEIIEFANVTRVPMVPAFIRGVTNLRGSVVPVVDLGVRLGRPPARINKRSCIVIVELTLEEETLDLGLVVDGVNSVLDIADGEIEPAPEFGVDIPTEFIAGMGKVEGRFIILLDGEVTLAVEALSRFGGRPTTEEAA